MSEVLLETIGIQIYENQKQLLHGHQFLILTTSILPPNITNRTLTDKQSVYNLPNNIIRYLHTLLHLVIRIHRLAITIAINSISISIGNSVGVVVGVVVFVVFG